MIKRMLITAAAALLVPVAVSAGPMKAGKWRVTLEAGGRKGTVERCVTQADAANTTAPPKMKDASCTVVSMNVTTNMVAWKLSCEKSGMTAESKTTYTANSFTGETKFRTKDGKETVQKTTGKYLGACGKK